MKRLQILGFAILVGAILGLSIFGLLVVRATTVRHPLPDEARRAFEQARARFPGEQPLVLRGADGRWVVGPPSSKVGHHGVIRLVVLAWQEHDRVLVRTSIPAWFPRIKEPALRWMLRRSRFDPARLGLSMSRIEREGPRLLVDDTRPSGDRLLVWTD